MEGTLCGVGDGQGQAGDAPSDRAWMTACVSRGVENNEML